MHAIAPRHLSVLLIPEYNSGAIRRTVHAWHSDEKKRMRVLENRLRTVHSRVGGSLVRGDIGDARNRVLQDGHFKHALGAGCQDQWDTTPFGDIDLENTDCHHFF